MSEAVVKKSNYFPNYRVREIAGKYLLTGNHGRWTLLNEEEYEALEGGSMSNDLFTRLEDKGLISTGLNTSKIGEYFRSWNKNYFIDPTLHIVVTTRRCNLRCVYCHASSRLSSAAGEDLDPYVAEAIVNFILKSPARQVKIEFQGGESLLNFDIIRQVVTTASAGRLDTEKSISFCLVSNLTLLDEDMVAFFRRHNVGLSTSLDGPDQLHNSQRPYEDGTGSFDRVMSQIALARANGINVGLLGVLTAESIPYYKQMVDLHVALGMENLCFNPVMPLGRARGNRLGMSAELVIKYYREMLDYSFEYNSRGSLVTERMFLLALDKLTMSRDVGFADFRSPCGAFFGQVVYDVNGDIYPCDEARGFAELKLGNVMTHTYEELFESEKAWDVVSASLLNHPACAGCAYQPFCGLCPLRSYSEGKGLHPIPPDDFRCQLNRFLFDYVLEKMINHPDEIASIQRYRAVKHALGVAQHVASEPS